MGGIYKKSELDFSTLLLDCFFVMKGKAQEIHIYTSAEEVMDFVDYLNNNPIFNKSYDKVEKDKFGNKFYTLNDYKKRASVSINIQDIKCFQIPWFVDTGEHLKSQVLQFGK